MQRLWYTGCVGWGSAPAGFREAGMQDRIGLRLRDYTVEVLGRLTGDGYASFDVCAHSRYEAHRIAQDIVRETFGSMDGLVLAVRLWQ